MIQLRIIDLSRRKPKWCPNCKSTAIEERRHSLNYWCKECGRPFVKLIRGELYLKMWVEESCK